MVRFGLTILSVCILSCARFKTDKENTSELIKDSLDLELTQIQKQGFFNGFGVAIVNENGALYQNGFGFSDVKTGKKYTESTIQNIASISKTFVGVALMKAQETGKLNLDEPVNKYLPFPVFNPKFPEVSITIRQLANHTSSIADNDFYLAKDYLLKPGQDLKGMKLTFDDGQVFNAAENAVGLQVFLEKMLMPRGEWFQEKSFTNHKPGEIYEYSNVGTVLAAYVVEKATGMAFNDFTKKYILQPLKMNASGWKFDEINFSDYSKLYENPKTVLPFYSMISYPDGNFISSVDDMGKYLSELIKGYNGKGTILSKASYKELFRPQLSANQFLEREENNPYSESYNVGIFMGFGFSGYVGHTGGDPGVMSMMFFDPKTNLGRILILNTNFSDKAGNDAFYHIWDVLQKYEGKLQTVKP